MKKYAELCWLLVLAAACISFFAAIVAVSPVGLALALFATGAGFAGLFYSTDTTPIR